MRLVLASQSPRRIELLGQLGIPFTAVAPNCDEACQGPASAQAKELALRKALCVSREMDTPCVVLGADTLVELSGMILGKPQNEAHAKVMLRALSGKWHNVHTGVAMVSSDESFEPVSAVETVRVHFAKMSESDIVRYVQSGEALDKAGAYGIQGVAGAFIDRIEGDYYAVVGLPLCRVRLMLKMADVYK
jgi:septum formation protein